MNRYEQEGYDDFKRNQHDWEDGWIKAQHEKNGTHWSDFLNVNKIEVKYANGEAVKFPIMRTTKLKDIIIANGTVEEYCFQSDGRLFYTVKKDDGFMYSNIPQDDINETLLIIQARYKGKL